MEGLAWLLRFWGVLTILALSGVGILLPLVLVAVAETGLNKDTWWGYGLFFGGILGLLANHKRVKYLVQLGLGQEPKP